MIYNAAQGFSHAWERLTRPSAMLTSPDERGQASLLAGSMLAFLPLAIAATFIVLPLSLSGSTDIETPHGILMVLGVGQIAVTGLAYSLSRSRHYKAGALLFTISLATVIYLSAILSQVDLVGRNLIILWLPLMVLAASTVVSTRATTTLSITSIVMVSLLPLFTPAFELSDVPGPLIYTLAFCALIVLSKQYHNRTYMIARRQAKELALLDEVRTSLAREVSLPALFRMVMKSITEAFGYTNVSLYLLEGDTLVLQDQAGYEHILDKIALSQGICGRVARTGKPVLVEDVQSDPDFLPSIQGIMSEVCVPLMKEGHAVGILNVESTHGIKLTEADLHLMVALSEDIEIAISRAQLYQDIQQQLAERKRAEEALRESQQLLSKTFASLREAIFIVDAATTNILDCNPAASAVFGYTREEMLGQTTAILHVDEAALKEFRHHLSSAVEEKGFLFLPEFRMKRKDGGIIYTEHSVTPVEGERGERVGWVSAVRDVTERKWAEEQLRRSEAALRQAQRVSHVGNWAWHIKADHLEWSDEMYHIFGLEKDGFSGSLPEVINRAIHPEDRGRVEESDRRVSEEKIPTPLEYRVIWPDGSVHTVWAEAGELSVDDQGNPTVLTGIVQDITERKRAEEALRESQAEYRSLVENSLQGMVIFQDMHIVFVNDAMSNITGYSVDEMLAMSPRQTANLVHPEDQAWVATNIQHRLAGLPVKPFVEHRFVRADGQIRTVEFLSNLITYRSKPAIQATYFDITERVEAERELERNREHLEELVQQRTVELRQTSDRIAAILDSVGEAIMVVKPDGRIEQVNRAFEEQTGYAATEVERRNHRDFLFDDGMPRELFEASTHAMRTGQGWRGEMPVRRKDGSRYDAAVTITTMFNPTGKRVAFVGILRDISAQKEVERMKDTFVSNVSHELRTPITNIKLYLDLLDMNPAKHVRYVEVLKRENTRLQSLIEGLLRLSRLDQSQTTVNLVALDLNDLVAEYVADRSLLAKNNRLKLTFKPASTLPTCMGDRQLLGQVLSILLTNALNYTPSGGSVRVNTKTRQIGAQEWVGVSVIDTGPGIAPGETGKLFTRFFRGKAGLSSGIAGTGLGLAIAREIVTLHHGEIEASNNLPPAGGATFRVWLPMGTLQSIK